MKPLKVLLVCLLAGLVLAAGLGPVTVYASPYEPSVLKVSVDDSFWSNYYLPTAQTTGDDIVNVYRVTRAELTLLVNNREFATLTFTPKDSKEKSITIPYGLTNLSLRLKTFTADNTCWVFYLDYQKVNFNRVTISSVSGLQLQTPTLK